MITLMQNLVQKTLTIKEGNFRNNINKTIDT